MVSILKDSIVGFHKVMKDLLILNRTSSKNWKVLFGF